MERTVTLTLTENCNLACIYCYEQHRNGRTMPLLTAKRILDAEFSELSDNDFLTIDFFGGEPFLEFELIKKIVNYVNKRVSDGDYHAKHQFFATTNGTLIHGEIKEWLLSHENFILGLSLDGTKKMHDLNRSHSFDQIDIDFFASHYRNQIIKMTISDKTITHLAEGVIQLHEKGFGVACNLAFGLDWSNAENRSILLQQLELLIEYYLAHPQIPRATILSRKISYMGYTHKGDEKTVRKWCGTGTAMRTYDVDGARYPCQFFMPVSCGKEKASQAWKIHFSDEISLDVIDVKCRECIARDCCPTCYGSNYVSTGNVFHKDDNLCYLEKITFYANAVLAIRMWDEGYLQDLPNEKLLATLIAARKIIENFESKIH